MAAGEDESQLVVRHGAHLLRLGLHMQQRSLFVAVFAASLTPQPIDRAVARRRENPAGRTRWHSLADPPLGRDDEGVLHCILGDVDVTEEAHQCCDGAP